MDGFICKASEVVLSLAKNIHLEFSLSGWPAAVSVVAICGTGVAIYALSATQQNSSDRIEQEDR